ncbi:response regulator transcription factor [Bacillus salitolerans]|uniref:Response regulator transcription factor n=1 Tax=Bacillus salitolerans TaxID=1437434 RepID=A0ABW4LPM2_9BACI
MSKENILVIDDESTMRRLIRLYLDDSYDVVEAMDGFEALNKMKTSIYDLIILDIMMPGIDGWEVCNKIRETDTVTPILMLTARSDVSDRVHGLTIGADDYLGKPFEPEELLARVHALLRRSATTSTSSSGENEYMIFDALKIGIENRQVFVQAQEVVFTPKEFDLLFALANHPSRVFTREILLDQIWVVDEVLDVRTVDTHIKNIREKLKKAGLSYNPIKTVWGVGYKFNPNEDSK